MYLRISQDRNGEGLAIERQRELLEKKAADLGWRIGIEIADRDISAYSRKRRPGWEQLLADLRAGVLDGVLAVDQDRLARRLSDLGRLLDVCEERKAPIVLLSGEIDTTTADGILKAQILGSVAENESRKKSERERRQRDQAAAQGRYQGGRRPFGYERDGVTIRFRLFLSHIYEHRDFVVKVKNELWSRAISAFIAHQDIAPTQLWRDEIENALNSCHAAAAFLHQGFKASDWADQEVGFAVGRGLIVVPICLGEMPYGLMEKFQGIRAESSDPSEVATAVADTLIDNTATQAAMAIPAVNRFEQADNEQKAQNWIRRLDRFATLPPDLLQRIAEVGGRNTVIANAKGVTDRIAALLERHGYAKPAASILDDYGEDPF
jgi:DNA invertase Pin-like site-specific DNA recombinase